VGSATFSSSASSVIWFKGVLPKLRLTGGSSACGVGGVINWREGEDAGPGGLEDRLGVEGAAKC
jgi:hypothetical protein